MQAPIITFQSNTPPYSVLNSITYQSTSPGGQSIPVVAGTSSNNVIFRIYNNYGMATNIADALNCYIITYDGVGAASHTQSTLAVSQDFINIFEDACGANSATNVPVTMVAGSVTAIGTNTFYAIQIGSDGSNNNIITSYTNNNGVGFIEFTSFAQVPEDIPQGNYNFAISLQYVYTS